MQVCIADFAGVCIASVCRIVKRVSEAIARRAAVHIKMPANEIEMREAAAAFYELSRFPRTIGAIDCTHIKIQSPGGLEAERYRNRKGWFSLNVQTMSAANLKIIDIVARWPGICHDQTIFNASSLKMRLESGEFGRYIIVADSGYANTSYLATPFLQLDCDPIKNLFNESQIRTRNVVERSYGVLKRRFPVLSTGLRISLERVEAVIVACAVLHNICIDAHDALPPDPVIPQDGNRARRVGDTAVPTVRDILVRGYFTNLMNTGYNILAE